LVDLAYTPGEAKPMLNADEVARLSRDRGEAEWLATWRRHALDRYLSCGLPARHTHLWRYTDPVSLLPVESTRDENPIAMPAEPAAPVSGTNAFDSGDPVLQLLGDRSFRMNDAARDCGLEIYSLSALAGSDARLLGQAVPARRGVFEALNSVLWASGIAVRIPAGLQLDRPLRILVPATERLTLPRLLIIGHEGATATVVEEHYGGLDASRVIGVSEVIVAANAHLRHVLLQHWRDGVGGHLTTRGVVGRDASLSTVVGSFGGALTKLDLGARLTEPGARSDLAGVALGEGEQRFDHHTAHLHEARHTSSTLDFKVALSGAARSAYTGLIRVDEQAAGSDAYQENRNLLLSTQSRAHSIPELEILTDDVSCAHGATVAPVDEQQRFYLRSRGLDRRRADRLIVKGFLDGTLRALPAAVRPTIETLVDRRLRRATGGQE